MKDNNNYPARVRLAAASDEEEIMGLCRQLHQENGIFPINEDKVRKTLQAAFNKLGGVLAVIGAPGAIEGLIYMAVSTFWYSDEPHLEELFLYVKPEYRRSRDALELMRFAKWCSAQTGFKLIIGVISNERTEGKIRLYKRQFDNPVGNFFCYSAAPAVSTTQH